MDILLHLSSVYIATALGTEDFEMEMKRVEYGWEQIIPITYQHLLSFGYSILERVDSVPITLTHSRYLKVAFSSSTSQHCHAIHALQG